MASRDGIRKLASGRYQVRYMHLGVRHTAPSTFGTIADAKAWLRDELTKVDRGVWVAPKKAQVTFREFAEGWLSSASHLEAKTKDSYRQMLDAWLLPEFGNRTLGSITPTQVRTWHGALPGKIVEKEFLRTHPRKDVTGKNAAAKCYRLLSQIFKLAIKEGALRAANPCTLDGAGKEPERDVYLVSVEEQETVMAAMPEREHLMVLLAGWEALRTGESLGLRRSSFDLDRRTVTVMGTRVTLLDGTVIDKATPKSVSSQRTLGIPPHIFAAVVDHLERFVYPEPDAYVFIGGRDGKPLSRNLFYRHWNQARLKIGQPTLHPHDLRHAAATRFGRVPGVSGAAIMYFAGHSSMKSSERYQHTDVDHNIELVTRMSELYAVGDNVIPIGHDLGTKVDSPPSTGKKEAQK